MNRLRRRLTGPWLLALLTAAVVASILYSRATRRITLGSEFRYIPKENTILVATGDLASLHRGAEFHLRDLLAESSPVRALLAERLELEVEDLELPSLEELTERGLDVRRGILFSLYRTKREGREKFVAVLPITDRGVFTRALAEGLDETVEPDGGGEWAPDGLEVVSVGDVGVAFPEPGLAVASNSPDLLERSLTLADDNLRHAANNDSFYKGSHRVLRGPLLSGSNVFLFWQSRSAPFGELAAALRLLPGSIRIEADMDLAGGDLRILDEVLAPGPDPGDWKRNLPVDAIATLAVQDRELSHVLDLAMNAGALTPQLTGFPIGSLRVDRSLEQAVLAIASWEGLVPSLVVGLWGDERALEDVALDIQSTLRANRDLRVLAEVLESMPAASDGPISERVLQKQGVLKHEPDRFLLRYEVVGGELAAPRYQPADFESESYLESYRDHQIRFLAPRLTRNDLSAVEALLDYASLSRKKAREYVLSDEDRLASVVMDGGLWIANDAQVLRNMVDRKLDGGPTLARNPQTRRLKADSSSNEKLAFYVNLDELASQILLGDIPFPLPEESDPTDLIIGHSAINVSIRRRPLSSRLGLRVEIVRRAWEPVP